MRTHVRNVQSKPQLRAGSVLVGGGRRPSPIPCATIQTKDTIKSPGKDSDALNFVKSTRKQSVA